MEKRIVESLQCTRKHQQLEPRLSEEKYQLQGLSHGFHDTAGQPDVITR